MKRAKGGSSKGAAGWTGTPKCHRELTKYEKLYIFVMTGPGRRWLRPGVWGLRPTADRLGDIVSLGSWAVCVWISKRGCCCRPDKPRQSTVESRKQIATEPRNGTKVQKTIWYFMRDFKLILTKLNWMHSCWWIVLHDSGLWHYTDTYIYVCTCVRVYTPYWNFVASDHNRRVPERSLHIYSISLCMKMHNRHAHTHRERDKHICRDTYRNTMW